MSSQDHVVSLQAQRAVRRPATSPRASSGNASKRTSLPIDRDRPLRPSAMGRTSPRASERAWPRIAVALLMIVCLLTVIGLVFILSASSVESINRNGSYLTIFAKQVWWEVLGLFGLLISQRLGVRFLERVWPLGWVACVGSLIAVFVVGVERNGSRRWLSIGGLEVQPSEIAKFLIVVALAHVLTLRRRAPGAAGTFVPVAIYALPLLACVGLQPDLGTTLVVGAGGFAVLFAGGMKWKYLGWIVVAGVMAVGLSVLVNPYQLERVTAFRNPKSAEAFHVRGSVESIQSGGISGVGVGAGRSKYGYIPNSHTDFIYSVISEETGTTGSVLVLGLFAALTGVGTVVALRAADAFSRLIAFGVTAWIASQALVNIAAVTGVAPVTGIPLPFVSQGGTSFVTLMVAVGVLLDIARRGIDPSVVQRREVYRERAHPSQHRRPVHV